MTAAVDPRKPADTVREALAGQERRIRISDELGPCYQDEQGVTVNRIGASDFGNCTCGALAGRDAT